MELTTLTRKFVYQGIDLPLPMTGMSDDQVRQFYADIYPELLNAAVMPGEVKGESLVVEFKRAVGTKG